MSAVLILHLAVLLIYWILAFTTDGTGGGGDSLVHYYIARQSWQEPILFFDQWGKPFFTFWSSLPSQFGFTGMKMFNIFCGVSSSYLAVLSARKLGLKISWAIVLFAFATPAFSSYLFSGLTEPFAALVLTAAVYFCLDQKPLQGFIIASFLGFCRTEAQVFLLFFLIYGLLNRHWKYLPLLISGYLIYGLIGWISMDNFWWILSSPYHSGESIYGKGSWDHYLVQIFTMTALASFVLLILGTLSYLYHWIRFGLNWRTEPWLIFGISFSLIFGHSLVWALGIYASAGLERTMILIFPLLWIIMLRGLNLIYAFSGQGIARFVPYLFLGVLLILTYTNRFTPHYWSLLHLSEEDRFIQTEVTPYIKEHFPEMERFAMDKPFFAHALDLNFLSFDDRAYWNEYFRLSGEENEKMLWIWDYRYVPMQYGISLDQLRAENKLREVAAFKGPHDSEFVLFVNP